MNQTTVHLNEEEIEAVQTALQLLSKKEQKLLESNGKVSLSALYNKFASAIQ